MTLNISIAYHSGYGHTEALAKAVEGGVRRFSTAQPHLIDVTQINEAGWAQLAQSDAIIFGSPTYMGAVSGPFKTFMDQTSKIWMERGWQNKLAAGFTVSGSQSGDKFATLSQLATLAAQHGMLWVSLGLLPGNHSSTSSIDDLNRIGGSIGAMAQANTDQGADLAPPQADRETAALLGERVARLAADFKNGRMAQDISAQPEVRLAKAG
ncbi:MAG: flavodoxin family protein [Rhizobiaceae bacterium]|nr:flavodoxin family protein [Rhizobiaceae bacterium]